MQQQQLIREVYLACVCRDTAKLNELRREEFKNIFEHKHQGKPFNAEWTVVRI